MCHVWYILSNNFFLDIHKFKFKHDHCTCGNKQKCIYLIPMYRTEFGKRNPINTGIKMEMELNIDVY